MVIGIRSYPGTRYTQETIIPGDTATGINKATWRTQGDRAGFFTSGGTYVTKIGDTITGATGAATAYVEAVVLESGSFAAGTAAGWLYLSNQVGTFQSENLDVGANSNVATIATDTHPIPAKGMEAVRAVVRIEDNDIRYATIGTTPTATSGTNPQNICYAGQEVPLESISEIRQFKAIDAVSGSASKIRVECFF